MNELRIIISGGGTGGHIFPAIAIANEVKKRRPDAKILFVGAVGKMEMEKVPAAGYEIKGLNIAGFQRGSVFKNLGLPFKLAGSLMKAYSIIKSFKPQVAVGVGGYASGPLLRVANFTGVATVIQEQNSFAGITNKLLAKKAAAICTAYEGMEKVFPKDKLVLTGNPVRAEIATMQVNRNEAYTYFGFDAHKKTILIMGGSLGARTLNQSVEAALDRIRNSDAQVLWQTGRTYFEACEKMSQGISNLKVLPFIDHMDFAYTCSDIIISRAGALSISELQLVGKPVILVPSPNVTEDHQTHNAMALVNKNAALMVKDSDAKVNLLPLAFDLLTNTALLSDLSLSIKKMAVPNASERIVDEILKQVKAA